MRATVTLEPWGSGDLPLLERLMGNARMTEHLGGPESPDQLRERQRRYECLEGDDRMFKIVETMSRTGVGSVGFWTKQWRGEPVYEIGWMVVLEFQGRGIALAATAQAIEVAKHHQKHPFMHAFPNVDNAPSNAICRKLAFELLGACEFEFPKGHFMTCNDWRLDLRPRDCRPPATLRSVEATHMLAVGDRVRVFGGYDQRPDWLAGGSGYEGTVVSFIPGQNEDPVPVVRFEQEIVLPDARGQYAVLELGHEGTTWATPKPRIHVELLDFEPEARRWQDRRQGAWVESHATYEVLPSAE